MQFDSEIGEYELEEIGPNKFVWCIRRIYIDRFENNLSVIINWWNDSNLGKRNWMLLNSKLRPDISNEYFVFEVTFTCIEEAMAFKLRWL